MWSVEYLPTVAVEEAALPVDMQARLARMADTIRQHGLLNLPRDWVKPLGGKLWELRITGKEWHCSRDLRYRNRSACGDRTDLRQEDTEDAAA